MKSFLSLLVLIIAGCSTFAQEKQEVHLRVQGKEHQVKGAENVIELRLPAVFSDNMVLQRNRKDPIWGSGEPGAKVKAEFLGHIYKTKTDKDGKWMLKLDAGGAGGPYTLKIICEDQTIVFNNILIGEVWVCSGQSNMEMPLEGWPNGDGTYRLRVKNYQQEIADAKYPDIRLLQLQPTPQPNEVNDIKVVGDTWRECSPETIPTFSSTAYFFAREVYLKTGIPIGLIESAVGGTTAELWASNASLNKLKDFPDSLRHHAYGPGTLFNGMIAPLIPYGIRGVIWYQGEFNADRAYQYCSLFPEMIKGWRDRWDEGNFPFYFVQLPIIGSRNTLAVKSTWAELREAQLKTLSLPNTSMVVTIDLPDSDLHPANKQDFGYRIAMVALSRLYGQKEAYMGPMYKLYKTEGNSIRLFFSNPELGLKTRDEGPLKGFVIAGSDSVFYEASARIDGNSIVVSSPNIKAPISVRYAWADNPANNLCSQAGVAASPFRTDDWPLITRFNKN